MTLRASCRVAALVALAVLAGPVTADPNAARALLREGEAAIAAGQGVTAQLKIEAAIAAGLQPGDARHLLANAFVLQGNRAKARALIAPGNVPNRYAGYAARMRAATAETRAEVERELALATRLDPRDSRGWSDLARLRIGGGDFGGAGGALETALALDPKNADALLQSANLVRDRYGYAAALPWYDRALGVQPRHYYARIEGAATLGDLGQARDALAATREVHARYPNSAHAYYLQAVIAARARDWALASALLGRTGNRLDAVMGKHLLTGIVELAQGHPEQAILPLRRVLDAQPTNFSARRLLASAFVASGDDRAAIDVARGLSERGDADPYTLTLVGRAYERLGNRVAAARLLDRAATGARGASVALPGSASRALEGNSEGGGAGVSYLRYLVGTGRVGDAQALAAGWAARAPGNPEAHVANGDTLALQTRWREAAGAFRRAADLRFDEATALRLIEAARRSGDARLAEDAVERLSVARPNALALRYALASGRLAARDWSGAANVWGTLRAALAGGDATVTSNLAWARSGEGANAEALSLARDAFARAPNDAAVVASYGWFAAQAGDRARGIALLEKAARLAPGEAVYRDRLAKLRAAR